MKIVITGKTDSGKTTLLKLTNLPNIYFADDFVKESLYKNDHYVFKEIKNKFPNAIFNNEINKSELAKIIFNDPENLNWINILIKPFIIKWIKSLPQKSIVEMATYLSLENIYSNYFDYVILIVRQNNFKTKLDYLNLKHNPLDNYNIKYDIKIKNDDKKISSNELKEILLKLISPIEEQ